MMKEDRSLFSFIDLFMLSPGFEAVFLSDVFHDVPKHGKDGKQEKGDDTGENNRGFPTCKSC